MVGRAVNGAVPHRSGLEVLERMPPARQASLAMISRMSSLAALLVASLLLPSGGCLPRPPDTPLHVRPTDGRPKSPAKATGGLYSSVQLREGSQGERLLQVASTSKLRFEVGVAARFGEPQVDSLPDPTTSVFGLGPYIRTVLHRQNLDVARGVVPISGTLHVEGSQMDSLRGELQLHLGDISLDEQSEDAGWGDDLKRELFGLPDSGTERAAVQIEKMRFGSGPRPGFEVRGDATFQLPLRGGSKSINVFMTLRRQDWNRYRWSSYQPIDLTVSEDFPDREAVSRLSDAWNVRKIADLVRVQIELDLEATN